MNVKEVKCHVKKWEGKKKNHCAPHSLERVLSSIYGAKEPQSSDDDDDNNDDALLSITDDHESAWP